MANENIRPEIIRSFEDVIDLSRHDAAILKLMYDLSGLCEYFKNVFCCTFRELIPDDSEFLTSLTVDTFGNMCIGEGRLGIFLKLRTFFNYDYLVFRGCSDTASENFKILERRRTSSGKKNQNHNRNRNYKNISLHTVIPIADQIFI
jgi:hypothetical protein